MVANESHPNVLVYAPFREPGRKGMPKVIEAMAHRDLGIRTEQATNRLSRPTNPYLAQALDKPVFEGRKAAFIGERRAMKIRSAITRRTESPFLAKSRNVRTRQKYEFLVSGASHAKMRLLMRTLMSNRMICGKSLNSAWKFRSGRLPHAKTVAIVDGLTQPQNAMGASQGMLVLQYRMLRQ